MCKDAIVFCNKPKTECFAMELTAYTQMQILAKVSNNGYSTSIGSRFWYSSSVKSREIEINRTPRGISMEISLCKHSSLMLRLVSMPLAPVHLFIKQIGLTSP